MIKEIKEKYWIHHSLMLIVGILGVAYSVYLGFSVHKNDKENLLTRTRTISQFITAKDIALLHGSEEDLNNPAYIALKDEFMAIRSVNSDVRFIYLNGIREGRIFFYVDSENADSPDYSPPGQKYDEASSLVKRMFRERIDGFEIAGDRWGMWASALVPIVDSESGKTVALLGMDVPARKYITDILAYSLSALLFASLVIVLLIGQKRAVKHMCLVEESVVANNLEIMQLKKIIEEKEQKIDEIKKKISEV